jgi:hypothetical protein
VRHNRFLQTVRLKTSCLVCKTSVYHFDFLTFHFLVCSLKSSPSPPHIHSHPQPWTLEKSQEIKTELFWRFASYCYMKGEAHCVWIKSQEQVPNVLKTVSILGDGRSW